MEQRLHGPASGSPATPYSAGARGRPPGLTSLGPEPVCVERTSSQLRRPAPGRGATTRRSPLPAHSRFTCRRP